MPGIWKSDFCCCCQFTNSLTKEGRCCPIFCPLACIFPCCLIGQIYTLTRQEEETCCEMGNGGCFRCCCSVFPLCTCYYSIKSRYEAGALLKKEVDCCDGCAGICIPCSLFQVYVTVEEIVDQKKLKRRQKEEANKIVADDGREVNKITELVLKNSASMRGEEDYFSVHGYDPRRVNELEEEAGELKKGTESRSPRKSDVSDRDSESSSPRKPRRSEDKSSDDREDNKSQRPKAPGSKSPEDASTRKEKTATMKPAIKKEKVDDDDAPHVLRVTIPPNNVEGSYFEVKNPFDGSSIVVQVPVGGKPGMKMDVPL